VNVHPSKTEVRFRQQQTVHDFVCDSVRTALMKARPIPQFVQEIKAQPTASQALSPGAAAGAAPDLQLQPQSLPPQPGRFSFEGGENIAGNATAAAAGFSIAQRTQPASVFAPSNGCGSEEIAAAAEEIGQPVLATLKPLGQIRNSFILAVNGSGLFIIDQHV